MRLPQIAKKLKKKRQKNLTLLHGTNFLHEIRENYPNDGVQYQVYPTNQLLKQNFFSENLAAE